jgi:hypothetical protein
VGDECEGGDEGDGDDESGQMKTWQLRQG